METHCRQELNGGSLPLFQKFFLLYRVLELQDREVQFDGCLFSVNAFGKALVFANFVVENFDRKSANSPSLISSI